MQRPWVRNKSACWRNKKSAMTRSEKEALWLLGEESTGECQGGNRESEQGLRLCGICTSGRCLGSIHIFKVELIGIVDEMDMSVREKRNQQWFLVFSTEKPYANPGRI